MYDKDKCNCWKKGRLMCLIGLDSLKGRKLTGRTLGLLNCSKMESVKTIAKVLSVVQKMNRYS